VRRYHLGELRLNGCGVNAFFVEELFDTSGNGDVVGRTATSDVYRGYDSTLCQLPYMQLVYVLDSFHLHHTVRLLSTEYTVLSLQSACSRISDVMINKPVGDVICVV